MEKRYSLITLDAFTNPYAVYKRMREEVPVYWVEMFQSWFLTRYDDVRLLLSDERMRAISAVNIQYATLSAEERVKVQAIDDFLGRWSVFIDPPEHTRLRRLLNKGFQHKIVANLGERIQEIANELIDDLQTTSQVEFITQFAYPLPVLVIAEMLGIPEDGRELLKTWAKRVNAFFAMPTLQYSPETEMMHQTVREVNEYMYQLLVERRRHPQEDMITSFVEAEIDGDKLSDDELAASCFFLLFAGHETTQNLLGNGMLALLKHPDQYDMLKRNLDLVETAVEEFLRYDGPSQFVLRQSVVDIEIDGQVIKPGQKMFFGMGAANHDPAHFANPDELDISRHPNPHIMFGHGIHFCLGAPLARLEGKIAFETLLRRLPTLQLTDDSPIWRPSFTLRGLSKLPLSL